MKLSILSLSAIAAAVGATPRLTSQIEDAACSPLEVLVGK
jgi:hypothetical protein